jgi:hypothetical protein
MLNYTKYQYFEYYPKLTIFILKLGAQATKITKTIQNTT